MRPLYQIRESPLHFLELADPQPQEKRHHEKAEQEPRPVNGAVAAQGAPAEAVDNADHGIKAVKQPPLFRDNRAAELFKTEDNMATPCSVKAIGGYLTWAMPTTQTEDA